VGRFPWCKKQRRAEPATGRWLQHSVNRSRLDFPSVFARLSPEDFLRLGASEAKMDRGLKRKGFAVIGVLLFCAMTMQGHAATITVTNTNDSGPGSLRQALTDEHDGDTIGFSAALNGQTITLTSAELVIDEDITISGPGPEMLTVSSSFSTPFRIFHVLPGHSVAIQGLMITGGIVGDTDPGGGILNDHATLTVRNCAVNFNYSGYAGGGIFNDGSNGNATLTIVDSTVSSNFSPFGAGIVNEGDEGSATLTIVDSAVNDNRSTNGSPPYDFGVAGGIGSSGIVTISKSTISGNLASNEAGGIASAGELTITDSTISGNGAGGFGQNNWPGRGGGISALGSVTISNSTISGNSAWGNDFKGPGYGGGIAADTTGGEINNCTISGNGATIGGGISTGGGLGIGTTILNNFGANIDGAVTSHGYNVSSDNGGGFLNGPGDQINTDPMLGALQDNGGPTLTHALLPGSPAIDAGDPNFTPPPFYDQRGPRFRRVFNGRIDVGSFETQPEPPPFPSPRPRPTPLPRPAPVR
jgi:hypothetical protein